MEAAALAALSEAGLPLSWVPEDCGGSGASLAEGFSVLSAAGRFAIAVPLAETMLAGWLLSQAKIASPEGAMTVAPAKPEGPHRAQCRRQAVRPRARRSLCQGRRTFCRAGAGLRRPSIALVDAADGRIEAGLNLAGDGSDTVTFANAAPVAIKPAPKGFDQTALMLMGSGGAKPADRRRAGIDARHQRALFQ